MVKWVQAAGLALLVSGGGLLGYRFAESRITVDIYRQRLHQLSDQYNTLRETYNEAVRKTAVTELIVEDGSLRVAIRTADGSEQVIDTPFDPSMEIYCDYVLLDGRLWIRRVYDDATPPREGVQIDPALAYIDWDAPGARYGNAVYRSLDEGRWIVTVTGDGSLGLVKTDGKRRTPLAAAPDVRDYEQIEREIHQKVDAIGPGDVIGSVFGAD